MMFKRKKKRSIFTPVVQAVNQRYFQPSNSDISNRHKTQVG